MLQACLNGARSREEHPAVPLTPAELAAEAARARVAGARSFHVHPRGTEGEQTLAPSETAAAVVAIRRACRGAEVTLSTGAFIEPDPERRAALVREWAGVEAPDAASVNFSEEGAEEVCAALRSAGIEVEAGLASVADAERFAASGAAAWSRRALIEVPERDPDAAVAHAVAIETALEGAALGGLPILWHGEEAATWPVLEAAVGRGHSIRVGLEDVLVLPDGTPARDNAALVRAAVALYDR